jgi:transglutaminase-like putative cysteine protease
LETALKIRAGYDIAFQCYQDTPMVLMLSIHPSRQQDLLTEHRIRLSNGIEVHDYLDAFGNICTRLIAPPGLLEIRNDFIIRDSGRPDVVVPDAQQWDVGVLPDEALMYLLGSRYCDTQKLSDLAWSLFGGIDSGWQRVQAICDYVHNHIEFGYQHARSDRTASEGHAERIGVCRDFAHLAVTLCRCMNIPLATARAISAISACRAILLRWISAPGSKLFSTDAGSPSMPDIIIPALDEL